MYAIEFHWAHCGERPCSLISSELEQGCPTFFLGGPHSELGHRRRATYQWRSQRRIFKGSKSGCVQGDKRVWTLEGNYAVN